MRTGDIWRAEGEIRVNQLRDNQSHHQCGERVDDFELDSGHEERDRAHVHDSQNRTAGLGYASPRGQGRLHRRAPSRQRVNESHDYNRDMHGPGMQACVLAYRKHYWQDRGVVIPLRGPPEGGGIETNP